MTLSDLTSREAVIEALEEFDRLGREAFLQKYGFGEGRSYFVVWNGNRYDSKAIAGVAHGHQYPHLGPLRAEEFSGGAEGAAGKLQSLGFEIDDVDTPTKVMRRFAGMRASSLGPGVPAPHKGLLALMALRKLRNGEPRLQPTREWADELGRLLTRALPQIASPSPWEPIWRMENTLWTVTDVTGAEIRPSEGAASGVPVARVDREDVMCGLTEGVHQLLADEPEWISRIERMLVEERLSTVPADVIADAMGLEAPPLAGDPAHRLLVVHVPQASKGNFEFSEPKHTWGWKEFKEHYSLVSPGDTILFALDFKGGSPRQQHYRFVTHSYGRVLVGTVTSSIDRHDSRFWPDEVTGVVYPWRLSFSTVNDRVGSIPVASLDEEFGLEVSEALRLSAINQSQAVIAGSLASLPVATPAEEKTLDTVVASFADDLNAAGWDYGGPEHRSFVRRFVVSLATKPFVILTGLSGSGKTQIALQFGRWLGADQMEVIAVRPDWTSPEALLGYEDGLSTPGPTGPAWHVPAALQFMLRACADPERPYLLVLDEMNLAHVERYFADVLSGMESGSPIIPNLLHDSDWRIEANAPARVPLPSNLFVVGTVNIDETTYMFSPKVLDRANTIEFRVRSGDLRDGDRPQHVSAVDAAVSRAFLTARELEAQAPDRTQVAEALRELHGHLSTVGMEFGHRTFAEALRFCDLLHVAGEPEPLAALDVQVLQKVLPKFHGSIREMTAPLNILGSWCFGGPGSSISDSFDATTAQVAQARLPLSFEKVQRMVRRLRANHFVSFAE